jgi:hypothetical protein
MQLSGIQTLATAASTSRYSRMLLSRIQRFLVSAIEAPVRLHCHPKAKPAILTKLRLSVEVMHIKLYPVGKSSDIVMRQHLGYMIIREIWAASR